MTKQKQLTTSGQRLYQQWLSLGLTPAEAKAIAIAAYGNQAEYQRLRRAAIAKTGSAPRRHLTQPAIDTATALPVEEPRTPRLTRQLVQEIYQVANRRGRNLQYAIDIVCGKNCGLTPRQISDARGRYGLEPKRGRKPNAAITSDQIHQILRRTVDGTTVPDAAAELGLTMTPAQFNYYRKKFGIPSVTEYRQEATQ